MSSYYFARFASGSSAASTSTARFFASSSRSSCVWTPVTSTSLRKVLNFTGGDAGPQPKPLPASTLTSYSVFGARPWTTMTNALLKALKDNPLPLYPDLFRALHANLRKKGFRQRPQLTSSQPFDVSNRVFSLTDGFVPNHNAVYGVPPGAKHRHRRRRRGRRGTGGMGLEGVLAAGLGAGILASVFG